MATRMFTVDLGAWSVKLAIATPGIRGATLINVVERMVPQGDEPVELHEAAFVEQQIQPLARGELPLLVLLGDPRRPPALLGEGLAVMKLFEELTGVGHRETI